MRLSTITALLAISLGAFAAPTPAEGETDVGAEVVEVEVEPVAQAKNYPKIAGYDQRQSNNAWAVINQIKKEKFGKNALAACKAAFATALVESNLYNYANSKVLKSLNYPHDKVGKDNDSVGDFQQRVKYHPLAQAMDPAKSAHLFFNVMKSKKDWEKKETAAEIGALCQKIQGSAYPNRYEKRVGDAIKICKAGKIS